MASTLANPIDAIAAETDFSGVVVVSRDGVRIFEAAYGLADRAQGVPNSLDTRFGIASGTKAFTALAVVSLIDQGELTFDTPLRSLCTDSALALVDPRVTVEHLLGHTSGVGDYMDEDDDDLDVDVWAFGVPAQALTCPADVLAILGGVPQKFDPGSSFSYCNGGYVMLALVIEAATGRSYYDVLDERVFTPAGMMHTSFPRADELPDRAAVGYIRVGDAWRSNIYNVPVRGCGDGGAYSTVGDFDAFWSALFAGRILPLDLVEIMVRAKSDVPTEGRRYGLGFWLRPDRETAQLDGFDAGISFRSAFDRTSSLSYTVVSNSTDGAWPIVRHLEDVLPDLAGSPGSG